MPIWPVLTKIMSITRTPSGMVCTEGGSLYKGAAARKRCREVYGLREASSPSPSLLATQKLFVLTAAILHDTLFLDFVYEDR